MFKAMISIYCDFCRRPYPFSMLALPEIKDWPLGSSILVSMALDDDWTVCKDGRAHCCPSCSHEMEKMALLAT